MAPRSGNLPAHMVARDPRALLAERSRRDGDCIIWTGPLNNTGYGVYVNVGGKRMLAHRAAWVLARGPIPAGLVTDHRCNRPACINVEHLDIVTFAENMRRAGKRGRLGQRRGRIFKDACPRGHTRESGVYDGRRCAACRRAKAAAKSKNYKPRPAAWKYIPVVPSCP